ncbi:hypothetical protein Tco_0308855, partial [Tanacetum coccineum]
MSAPYQEELGRPSHTIVPGLQCFGTVFSASASQSSAKATEAFVEFADAIGYALSAMPYGRYRKFSDSVMDQFDAGGCLLPNVDQNLEVQNRRLSKRVLDLGGNSGSADSCLPPSNWSLRRRRKPVRNLGTQFNLMASVGVQSARKGCSLNYLSIHGAGCGNSMGIENPDGTLQNVEGGSSKNGVLTYLRQAPVLSKDAHELFHHNQLTQVQTSVQAPRAEYASNGGMSGQLESNIRNVRRRVLDVDRNRRSQCCRIVSECSYTECRIELYSYWRCGSTVSEMRVETSANLEHSQASTYRQKHHQHNKEKANQSHMQRNVIHLGFGFSCK